MKGLIKRKVTNILMPPSGKNGVSTFQRISWTHCEKPMFSLIQYVGDDSVSLDIVHKNSKKDIPYIRDLEVGTKKPFQTYQEQVFNATTARIFWFPGIPPRCEMLNRGSEKRRKELIP